MCRDQLRFSDCEHLYKRELPCRWPTRNENRGYATDNQRETVVLQACDRYSCRKADENQCPACVFYRKHYPTESFDPSEPLSPTSRVIMEYVKLAICDYKKYPPSYSQERAPPAHRSLPSHASSLASRESTYSFTSNTTHTTYATRSTQHATSWRIEEEASRHYSSVAEAHQDETPAHGVPSSHSFAQLQTKATVPTSKEAGSRPSSMSRFMQKLSTIDWHRVSTSRSSGFSQSSRGFWDMFSIRNRSDKSLVCVTARESEQKFG